jgi:hypothetical protein
MSTNYLESVRQAILNGEEAAWVEENFPEMWNEIQDLRHKVNLQERMIFELEEELEAMRKEL